MKEKASKYKQIVNHVLSGIMDKKYKNGDKIPSINEFCERYHLSRDTVFSGIKELKSKGIIDSAPGIGYYVVSTRISFERNIFLLFNEFNEFKEDLYKSFIKAVGKTATVDLFFHNYNRRVFESLISEANGKYTTYVVMSGKFEGIAPLLDRLSGQVFLLDHFHPELKGKYSSVFQNFEKDTYQALVTGIKYLEKYRRIIMVQKEEKEPQERYDGLCAFCREYAFEHRYVGTVKNKEIKPGDVFMVVKDRDLVDLLKLARKQHLKPGKDFGIISYNDTPLKEILYGGITTLSTDFKLMGRTLATLINTKTVETIENPCRLIIRKSL
ncbi:MAG: GntR family transcriptional regulator [Bacteroidales bacterium]|jgi:DNA-binding transcriptional regulator YhcF (GntR family)|nr:GntR family transcriptional regulator [Bacteroidales bacterium]